MTKDELEQALGAAVEERDAALAECNELRLELQEPRAEPVREQLLACFAELAGEIPGAPTPEFILASLIEQMRFGNQFPEAVTRAFMALAE